jgi:hypothetical protein
LVPYLIPFWVFMGLYRGSTQTLFLLERFHLGTIISTRRYSPYTGE